MGVGRTVYKGEVETGVFAWSLSRHGPILQAPHFIPESGFSAGRNSDAAFAAPKLTQIDDGELGLSMFEGGPRR
ncbi:Mitochondrial pyruvate carrier [Pseudomonas chlororaphis]